jgi:hypothetical protein
LREYQKTPGSLNSKPPPPPECTEVEAALDRRLLPMSSVRSALNEICGHDPSDLVPC